MIRPQSLKNKLLAFLSTAAILVSALPAQPAFAFVTFMNGTIALESPGAHVTTNATVQFTPVSDLPADGKIIVSFPNGFGFASPSVEGGCNNLSGTFTVTNPAHQVVLARKGDGGVVSASTPITCVISGIVNPGPGASGTFNIAITDKAEAVINSTPTILDINISNGILAYINRSQDNIKPNEAVHFGFSFQATDDLPANGQIKVTFPSGYQVGTLTAANCNGIAMGITHTGNLVTLSKLPGALAVPAGTTIQCDFQGMTNPSGGDTGAFLFQTATGAGTTIDATSVGGFIIFSGTIKNFSVLPTVTAANATNTLTVKFTPNDDFSAESKFQIYLPGFDLSKSTASCDFGNISTQFFIQNGAPKANTIKATRTSGAVVNSGTEMTCTINNVTNPATVGTTGTILISGMYKDDTPIFKNASTSGITITAALPTPPTPPAPTPTPTPTPPTPPSTLCSGFKDVFITDALCPAVTYVKDNGIFTGYPDGTFQTDNIINRVETTKVILVGFGKAIGVCVGNDGFSDSDASQWYCKYVHTAKLLGILKGYADGTLRPNQQINRVEMLKVFFVTMGKDMSTVAVDTNPYPDTPKDEWYAKYVQFAKLNALVDADASGKFNPASGMKRGDVALLFYRAHLASML